MVKLIRHNNKESLDKACELISSSGVICVPTETVYGLLCKYDDHLAIEKIYKLKNRPSHKSLNILVNDISLAHKYARFNTCSLKLAQKFWPGPLTLILEKLDDPSRTIGIRITTNEFINNIIQKLGHPVIATSINNSGQPSAVTYSDIPHTFYDSVDCIFDISSTFPSGIDSTIVRFEESNMIIIREGEISKEQLQKY